MSDNYGVDAPLSYNKYLKVRDLIGLQNCLSSPAQHNEMLFITIHQTYELWFKQILHEIDAAIAWMDKDDVFVATRALQRVVEIEKVLVQQIHILETMTPFGFLTFREELRPASGFQSMQFREIEFVSGLRDEGILRSFAADEYASPRLRARYDAPSLHDSFFALLGRQGFDAPLNDPAADEKENLHRLGKRTRAIVEILASFEKNALLFELQEAMIAHDEHISLWRSHHVKMVERMVGFKRGTGGSEGVGYLQKTLARKFFPELWDARTYLGPDVSAGCPIDHIPAE
jgi:tryptophan 2,3-dioxygenase